MTATYLTGPRGPEYRRDDTLTEMDSQGRTVSKCRWYVYDGLGSVVGEVDPNGNMTSSPKYDVYGLVRQNPGAASSAMGFVGGLGHLSEASTGLIYMRARYYDPSVGRFSSEDPIGHGRNWFVYCNNDPITESDPTGLATSGSGELDYDLAGAVAGFSCLAAVLAIIQGHNAIEQLACDGIYLAEQGRREKTSQAGQKQWWDAALKRHNLTQEDGRELHQEGISSRNGFSQEEIEAEMERLANDKYGEGE